MDRLVGHGAALLGRLEALKENPALRAFLRTLQRRPPTQATQATQGEEGEVERSVEEVLFGHLEEVDPEALVAKVSRGFLFLGCVCLCVMGSQLTSQHPTNPNPRKTVTGGSRPPPLPALCLCLLQPPRRHQHQQPGNPRRATRRPRLQLPPALAALPAAASAGGRDGG